MFQIKEQDKSPKTNFNGMQMHVLLDRKFKVMVINILTKVRRTFMNKVSISPKRNYLQVSKRNYLQVPNRNHRAENNN